MLYYFVTALLTPFMWLVLLVLVLLLRLRREWVSNRRLVNVLTALTLLLYLFCTPAVSYFAEGTLEWGYPPLKTRPADTQAIVVLSAGIVPPDAIRPRARLSYSSLTRCLRAAELYHAGPPCKVLLTGGKVNPERLGPSLADAMRDFMLRLGVREEDMLLETQSRSTYENAQQSAQLLRRHNLQTTVLLVTDATHLRRGVLCFAAQGVPVVPVGCRYRATEFRWSVFTFLPSADAAHSNQEVFHEWLGLTWYWLKGRI